MADLLTHVLIAYVFAVVLSWRYDWITPPMVAAAIVGAISPDLNRIELVVPATFFPNTLGISWDWGAFHTIGGSVIIVTMAAVIVPRRHRFHVASMVAFGAFSHHALDLLVITPSGASYPVLWPVSSISPDTPGIYRSSDRLPAIITTVLAGIITAVDRHRASEAQVSAVK